MIKNKKSQFLKILMVGAECSPFVKVGGLADVVGSLPKAVKKQGVEVRLILPLYGSINKKKYKLKKIISNIEIPSRKKNIKVNIWQSKLPKSQVKVYFIENKKYFGKKEVYTDKNEERFLFFSLASLYILPVIKFKPNVVHCHDSHTALIPSIIKAGKIETVKNLKTLYTIHNFRYQGKTGEDVLDVANLKIDSLDTLKIDSRDGDINFTVQGILNADIINTVSKKYAKEILTKEYGEGLEKIIRKRKNDLYGIINGIDLDVFNPSKDKNIFKNYSVRHLSDKVENKIRLQKKLKLKIDPNKPIAAVISRLVNQKGLNLITEEIIKKNDCQFIFLGTGSPEIEKKLKNLANKYFNKVSTQIKFDVKLAQQIYAGSDIFLMPSQFEPCGLGQMIAMRYGTIPVVRATGGLVDTVDTKTGFKFKEFTSQAFNKVLSRVLNIYYKNPKKWLELQRNCMNKDFSWEKSAKKYINLYRKVIKNK